MNSEESIPLPTIRRLPAYYHSVNRAIVAGHTFISTSYLAELLHLKPIQVRKDIEYTGVKGRTRIGYPCDELESALGRILGFEQINKAILVGTGTLGSALLAHEGFHLYGIEFAAAFDIQLRGRQNVAGVPLHHTDKMKEIVTDRGVDVAVLAVPRDNASEAARQCYEAGIRAIWNFSGAPLNALLPEDVFTRNADLGFLFSSFLAEYNHLKD